MTYIKNILTFLSPAGRWMKTNMFYIFDVIQFAGFVILMIMFINFNVRVAEQSKATQLTAENTANILTKQNETLTAIEKLAKDAKLTAEQKTNIIICMLQVPVDQRTTNVREKCREQAETQQGDGTQVPKYQTQGEG